MRRLKKESNTEFNDGFIYYDLDKGVIVFNCLWKRNKSNLEVLFSNIPNSTIINDIERYCYENKINVIFAKQDFENYTKFGFQIDTNGRMVKYLNPRPIKKDKSIPMIKRNYPMIASLMPLDLNDAKNQLF